jgi:hypothetical protein
MRYTEEKVIKQKLEFKVAKAEKKEGIIAWQS